MATTITIAALFVAETADQIFARGLELAEAVGLPVTSWRAGDPTRTLYKYLAQILAAREDESSAAIKAGFLSSAVQYANDTGDSSWLIILAKDVYNVDAPEATFATPEVTLNNGGSGYWDISAGDVTVQDSTTGKTYRNTETGVLSPGISLTLDFVADEAGAGSSVSANDIDTVVTTLPDVTITSSTAATARDEASPDEIGALCTLSLGSLSPNGPADAFEYVALTEALTGTSVPTRAKAISDSGTDVVTVYVGTASGATPGADITLVQAALDIWATPICCTPTAVSAATQAVAFTATFKGDDESVDVEALLTNYYAGTPISDGTFEVALSKLYEILHAAMPLLTSIDITIPTGNTVIIEGSVPINGAVSWSAAP